MKIVTHLIITTPIWNDNKVAFYFQRNVLFVITLLSDNDSNISLRGLWWNVKFHFCESFPLREWESGGSGCQLSVHKCEYPQNVMQMSCLVCLSCVYCTYVYYVSIVKLTLWFVCCQLSPTHECENISSWPECHTYINTGVTPRIVC